MPDHVHMVAPGGFDLELFARILRQHGRRFGCRWDVGDPRPATTREIIVRAIRYVLLDPVRDGLAADPWAWPWSTLRDLGGAVDDDWTRAEVRKLIRGPWSRVIDRVTQLDDGQAPRQPHPSPDPAAVASLQAIAEAAASALRSVPSDIRGRTRTRRLFVQLALAVGHPRRAELAALCGVTDQAIRNATRSPDRTGLACALRCLHDERLRRHDIPAARGAAA